MTHAADPSSVPSESRGNVGLVVADLSDSFFAPFAKAAQRQARRRGYRVYLADADSSAAIEKDLVRTLTTHVAGILLCSPHQDDISILRLSRDVPLVVVNRTVTDVPGVVADIAGGARQAIEHLIDLGHRRLVYIGGHSGCWRDRDIRRAAATAATARDVLLSVVGPFAPAVTGGTAAAEAIRTGPATGVLACNDLVAVGLLEALRSGGTDVPADMSVIGIGDTPLAGHAELTTVATPATSAGVAAVDLLLHSAGLDGTGNGRVRCGAVGRCATRVVLPATLIPRRTTGAGPSGGAAQPGRSSDRPVDLVPRS